MSEYRFCFVCQAKREITNFRCAMCGARLVSKPFFSAGPSPDPRPRAGIQRPLRGWRGIAAGQPVARTRAA